MFPSLKIVEEWLVRLKIIKGTVFSEEVLNWDIFEQILLEIEPYYYPCKAKKYLYKAHTIKTVLTVLRQIVKPHGLIFRTHERLVHRKKYYEYFRKLDEPDYYFYKLGKQNLNFWKNELKDLDLIMETELIHVINLVNRNTEHEVVIGIRLENYDSP